MIVLPLDLHDDDFEGQRKYSETINGDGTKSFQDVTEYTTEGSPMGAVEQILINSGIMEVVSGVTQKLANGQFKETDAYGNYKLTTKNADGSYFEAYYTQNDVFIVGKTTTRSADGTTYTEEVVTA